MLQAKQITSLAGAWEVCLKDGTRHPVRLPGTLDENGVGEPDKPELDTRLTRLHRYEGPAVYEKQVTLACAPGERLFLAVERSRELSLTVDHLPVPRRSGTLSTPYTFELTRFADGGTHTLCLVCDNSYPGGGYDEITYSSAATDETQTNWNGMLGDIALVCQPEVFVEQVRLLTGEGKSRVCVTVDAPCRWKGKLLVTGEVLAQAVEEAHPLELSADVPAGRTDVWADVSLTENFPRWDELEGHMTRLTVEIPGMGVWHQHCGIRTICSTAEGRLALNGRVIFLRGEANCATFPETGHEPMDVDAWRQVLHTYASYGVNAVRFHSHCPPDAAFTAADELGMLMQPELSHWDPYHALESEESLNIYRRELTEIIRALGHHPSFAMLSLGNELCANECGVARMHLLLREARQMDDTRLYAWGSNNFYGWKGADAESDFFTGQACDGKMLRATSASMTGPLNEQPPCTSYTFDEGVAAVRKHTSGPIIGFEVGQYEVLPDFEELADFHGVTRPVNYELIQKRVQERGMAEEWRQQVEATGELSLLCYREEVEAALRTRGMSGLSLLGLQDFPGQGTALVGMLNAHLQPKPYSFAQPGRFEAFFRPVLPLAMLPTRCFARRETAEVGLALANYGRQELVGPMEWTLTDGRQTLCGQVPARRWPAGQITEAGSLRLSLTRWEEPAELTLHLSVDGRENSYSLWVYPDEPAERPDNVFMTSDWREALQALSRGARVLLDPEPTKEAIPGSITSQFSPDFWSVGNFPQQEGAMGLLMDPAHPIFENFPVRPWSTWPWWQMSRGRAMLLPRQVKPLVRVLDCYKFLRPLALLAECRVGQGRLMLSGMGLGLHQDRVEVRALTASLWHYMASEAFVPQSVMTEAELQAIFTQEAQA